MIELVDFNATYNEAPAKTEAKPKTRRSRSKKAAAETEAAAE
jgi:hypothetical protein